MDGEYGFILTAESSDINGRNELRFYGAGSKGPFLLIFSPHKPLFFIDRESDSNIVNEAERRRLELVSFSGRPVDGLYFNTIDSYFNTKRLLQETGIRMYESDIRAEDRFLMERFINGSLEIAGQPELRGKLRVYKNPSLRPSGRFPRLSRLSLDIETGTDGSLYSVALHMSGPGDEEKLVLMRGDEDEDSVSGQSSDADEWLLRFCSTERQLIESFEAFVRDRDPDLIIGWHVIGFDLSFLKSRAEKLGIGLKIGRGGRNLRINEKRNGMFSAFIEGRIVVDGPQTLRTAFFKFENYKLETVARELLGRGKDITPEEDKVAEIERRFREDKRALAYYNLEDAVLVTEIFDKTAIIDQIVTRSLITGLQPDKVHMSVAAFDHFMLPQFHRKGIVAPDTADVIPGAHAAGGHVFTSPPGLYPHVAVLDFKSLYPTIMRTFFIDPYSRMMSGYDEVKTPVGISFSRSRNILPSFLADLMEKRAQAKRDKNAQLAQAVKILLNSFYGVMGTTGCRFYHPDLPTAITGTGQWILKNSASFLRELGYDVIYGDTDSVFVCLKQEEWEDTETAGASLASRVNDYFYKRLRDEFAVESKLEIEFEKHYRKFFLPPMRYTTEGARKKYAGLLDDGSIEFKGLEIVRSDWTELAGNFQQELFRRFFAGEDLKQWIREYIDNLKNGRYDDELLYKRRLKRSADEYTKTSPPHVKAARKLDPDGSRKLTEVTYLMTAEGPTPIELAESPPDYRHYIEKQIRPIADGVLFVSGDDFDSIIDGRQLDLFGEGSG